MKYGDPWEQLELLLEWTEEPWEGVSPRYLTRGSCVVDKSVVGSARREPIVNIPDGAQLTLFLKGNPSHGS